MNGIGSVGNASRTPHIGMPSADGARDQSSSANAKRKSSGSDEIKFGGQLKMLNRRPAQQQADMLRANFSEMMNNADSVTQIKEWLSKSVTHSASDNRSVAGPMLAMIRDNKEMLKALSEEGSSEKDAVAGFLTEALRSYNFAHHDSAVIKEFIGTFKEMDIPIHGNPDNCVSIASFAGLDYLPGHGVVMQDR